MEKAFRKTGIDIIGDVPWGTHLCQFYETREDLVDILVPYFKAGLENNEFCIWVTSEPVKVEDAKAALKKVVKNLDNFIKKGQIEILDYSEWYTKSGKFNANNVLQGWVEKEEQAVKRGFDGLRLTGNTFWLEKKDWRAFADYEATVDGIIGQHRMIAICTYSLDKCGASEVIDVVSNHECALIKRGGKWEIIESAERKRAEEEMAAIQEQFRQSQKMESIGRLAGGVAHGFNNLLTVIKGYSQLSFIELREGDPLRGNIEEIQKAAQRATDLTRQLLAFSRRQVIEMRVLDLNILLRDLDKMLRWVIGEDIELVMYLPEDLGRVKTDPGQIEQMIMNLAVNARDAMPNGGKLTIETANVELDEKYARNHVAVTTGRYVMLSVSDTGVGMTPEVREQVFEPFFTTKEKSQGTGLGLSTVYGIVKQSGGNIWVYSEPGKGTTFKIYLPHVDEPLKEIEETTAAKNGLPRGSETILVVEDEEGVRKLVVRGLEGQGYRVLDAPQGLDAFLIAEKHQGPIHLLVTDVVMPKVNGRELAERMASIRPGIKVLYMSGYTDNAITHHGILEKGMNYIQKPFSVDGLARKVREVLDK